jgi:predicted acyl esterase
MAPVYGHGGTQPGGFGLDQRLDEAKYLTYTSAPLTTDLEVTGDPVAEIYLSSSADIACFERKLCDVASDGTSSLVSYGGLNATHRDSQS